MTIVFKNTFEIQTQECLAQEANIARGGSRAAATSKMEHFVIIVNGWKPLTIITKRSILDVAAALDPPLIACLRVARIKSRIKGHHRYNYKCALGEKRKYLRESEKQHSKHVISRKTIRK